MVTKATTNDVKDGTLSTVDIDPTYLDGSPVRQCLRSLGTGSQQAMAGDDPRAYAGMLAFYLTCAYGSV